MQVVIEIPYTLIQALIFGTIMYTMIGFEWTVTKLFWNLYFIFIMILSYIYYGMMIIAASPNQEAAAVLSGLIYTTWTFFSGLVIPREVYSLSSSHFFSSLKASCILETELRPTLRLKEQKQHSVFGKKNDKVTNRWN